MFSENWVRNSHCALFIGQWYLDLSNCINNSVLWIGAHGKYGKTLKVAYFVNKNHKFNFLPTDSPSLALSPWLFPSIFLSYGVSYYYVSFAIRFTFVTLWLIYIRIYLKKCKKCLLVKWGAFGLSYRKIIRRMHAHGGQSPISPIREVTEKVTEKAE